MFKIKNPFEVNENDTIGSAIFKGAAKGYIKATAAGAIGLGILAVGLIEISKNAESTEEDMRNLYKVTVETNDGETYTHEWTAMDIEEVTEMAHEMHVGRWNKVEVELAL